VEDPPTLSELKERTTAPASNLSPEAEISSSRFHGLRPPKFELLQEFPWHRQAAYFFATGCMNIKQVADACDVTEPTIRNLLRQPWFQDRVTKLMAENGGRDIMALLKAEQFNSLVVMVTLRDSDKTPPPVRAGICRDILDRTLGKPIQRIETDDKTFSDDPVAEARQLKEELARSREREGD
jgi:hypothetical protein